MQDEELRIARFNRKIKKIDSSYIIVTMPQGLGDILFFCIFSKEYRRLHPQNKLALLVTKRHFLNLAELYRDCFDKILYVDADIFSKIDSSRLTFYYHLIYDEKNPQVHLADAVRNAIGVGNNVNPYYPVIYVSAKEKRRIQKLGVQRGRTVLISPEAVSCSIDASEEDWLNIADMLEKKGFRVFFNCGNNLMYGTYPKVFLSLRETLIFTHYAGYFIGFRSGLCDVISAFSDCRQIIVYPNNKRQGEFPAVKDFDINPNVKYMEYCSLKRAFPDRIITEFIYEKGRMAAAIEREFGNGENIG